MERHRRGAHGAVIAGGYLFAVLLALSPLGEPLMSVLPIRVSEASWRFGAVGLMTQAVITPFLGVALAGVVAYVAGHATVFRVLAMLLGGGAALLAAAAVVFVLDALEMRQVVKVDVRRQFDVAALLALLRLSAFAALAAVGSAASWQLRAARGPRRREAAVILPPPTQ